MFKHGTTRIGCEQCHVSHGSNALMTAQFSAPLTFPDGSARGQRPPQGRQPRDVQALPRPDRHGHGRAPRSGPCPARSLPAHNQVHESTARGHHPGPSNTTSRREVVIRQRRPRRHRTWPVIAALALAIGAMPFTGSSASALSCRTAIAADPTRRSDRRPDDRTRPRLQSTRGHAESIPPRLLRRLPTRPRRPTGPDPDRSPSGDRCSRRRPPVPVRTHRPQGRHLRQTSRRMTRARRRNPGLGHRSTRAPLRTFSSSPTWPSPTLPHGTLQPERDHLRPLARAATRRGGRRGDPDLRAQAPGPARPIPTARTAVAA